MGKLLADMTKNGKRNYSTVLVYVIYFSLSRDREKVITIKLSR